MADEPTIIMEVTELEEEFTVEPVQPTKSMDLETIEILMADRIATGG